MARPFQYSNYLIMATGRNKFFPFVVLSITGIRAYFVDRDAAESFVLSDNFTRG